MVDWVSNRNEYQEYFFGVKATGEYGWPYQIHVPIFSNSGGLILVGTSGPVVGVYTFTFTLISCTYQD
jgi:predicted membrane-bound spermidine synthase